MDASLKRNRQTTFSQAVADIDNIVRGWSNSFRFVNNRLIFAQIDKQIAKRVFEFRDWTMRLTANTQAQETRILGVFQTHDVEYKPLEEFLVKTNKKKVARVGSPRCLSAASSEKKSLHSAPHLAST